MTISSWLIAALLIVGVLPAPQPGPGAVAPQEVEEPSDDYAVVVDNRSYRDVIVYASRRGTRFRLGNVPATRTRELRASCGQFLGSETDFILRSIAGRSFVLDGAGLSSCDQRYRIVILPTGLEFSRLWIDVVPDAEEDPEDG